VTRLDEVINRLRELPEEEQEVAAMAIFAYITNDDRNDQLIPEETASAPYAQVES
jgi:hypothetical protein